MFDGWSMTIKQTNDLNYNKILNQVKAAFGYTWVGYVHITKAHNKKSAFIKSRKQIEDFINAHDINDIINQTDILKTGKYKGLNSEEFKLLLDYHIINEPLKEVDF